MITAFLRILKNTFQRVSIIGRRAVGIASIGALLALFSPIQSIGAPSSSPKKPATIEMDLDDHTIPITTTFTGNAFLIHGATDTIGTIVLVVSGGNQQYTLTEKQYVSGVWVDRVVGYIKRAPSYYALISSTPVNIAAYRDRVAPLGIRNAAYSIEKTESATITEKDLWEKVIRLNRTAGRYVYEPYGVKRKGKYLFNAVVKFPSDVPSGLYTVTGYIVDNGAMKAVYEDSLYIKRDGVTKVIYRAAKHYSILYALFVIFLSLGIGWLVGRYKK